MSQFRGTLIDCRGCKGKILVRERDIERGEVVCSHPGCGTTNLLSGGLYYDPVLTKYIKEVGSLTSECDPSLRLTLRLGTNIIGVGQESTLQLPRTLHNGRCYISRLHCTLTVSFDKWSGTFRYLLQDGAVSALTGAFEPSRNGTCLNNVLLETNDVIDVPEGGLITLGRLDTFKLTHKVIPAAMLESYRVRLSFDPDLTE